MHRLNAERGGEEEGGRERKKMEGQDGKIREGCGWRRGWRGGKNRGR